MKNALRAVEMRVLDIFEKIGYHRLNVQVHKFLLTFRKFQEANNSPHVANVSSIELEVIFQNLFKVHQLDNDYKMSDILIEQKVRENQALL
jgi:membrane protease subunit (stomatin/prohibitin family)